MGEGDDLMLCPYCNGTPTLVQRDNETHYVRCEACDLDYGYAGNFENPLYLTTEWNDWVVAVMESLDRYHDEAAP